MAVAAIKKIDLVVVGAIFFSLFLDIDGKSMTYVPGQFLFLYGRLKILWAW